MQVHIEPDILPTTENLPSIAAADVAPDLIYDLRHGHGNSDAFYADAARFSDKVLAGIEARAGFLLDSYSHHVVEFLCEAERSRGEYGLDLLTFGLALARYGGAAENTPRWVVALAREFSWMRYDSSWSRPLADLARAVVCRLFLAPKVGSAAKSRPGPAEGLPRLIGWMQATGEFEQEVWRLDNWRSFLDTLPAPEASRSMRVAVDVFDWFEREAAEALGSYTRGVPEFLAHNYNRRGLRQDHIFCGKPAVEYHLAMVAAEIINRGLRERFDRMARKVILAPACMMGACAATCKARWRGGDLTCVACDPDCAVNRLAQRMRGLNAEVHLVSHGPGFSRSLDRWQHEPNTGVVAAACLLNILQSGLEMRSRRIPSQCLPLDFPGCRQHWRSEGIPTGLNQERLVRIVDGVETLP
jgi:hypothetical protein